MKIKYSYLACAAVSFGVLASSLPANAMGLAFGSELNLQSPANTGGASFDASTGILNFFSGNNGNGQRVGLSASTGSFQGARSNPNPRTLIADLLLSPLGGGQFGLAAPVTNFLSGIDLNPPGVAVAPPGGDDVQFDLTSFVYNVASGDAMIEGLFQYDGSSFAGSGMFTSQLSTGDPSEINSYSLSITAEPVPTPALLPGLLGFGATLMRKRKQSKQDSVTGGLTEVA